MLPVCTHKCKERRLLHVSGAIFRNFDGYYEYVCTHIRYWFPLIKVWWFYFQFTFHLTHWVYNILYQCLIQLVHYIITCQNLPTFTQCVQITDHIALSVGMFRMFPRGDENCRGSPTFPSCCLVPRDVNFHLGVNFYMIFW